MDTCSCGIRSSRAFTSEVFPAPDGAAMTKSLPRRMVGIMSAPQFGHQGAQRLRPVTHVILLLGSELRCGVMHPCGNEDGVITESTGSARLRPDPTFPGAV